MPGLIRGMARTAAVVGTATAVSGNVSRRQQQKYASQDAEQQAAAAPQPMAAAPAASPQDAMMAEITQLSQLKDQGILTQEEFDAKKKQILGI